MSLNMKLDIGSFFMLILLITGFARLYDESALPRLEWSGELTLHQLLSASLWEKMRSLKVLMLDALRNK
jgi:hypothetical protein